MILSKTLLRRHTVLPGFDLALGFALMAIGKSVRLINEDGLPENLAFMKGSDRIETLSITWCVRDH